MIVRKGEDFPQGEVLRVGTTSALELETGFEHILRIDLRKSLKGDGLTEGSAFRRSQWLHHRVVFSAGTEKHTLKRSTESKEAIHSIQN